MDRIRAPYNFVPLSLQVVFPNWRDYPAQDLPFEDGISGSIEIELEAHTPIFVRGSEKPEKFFRVDDKFAVPGSALRGLLRNVVEIAGFGKLNWYDDRRYGVRDLTKGGPYQEHMAAIMSALGNNKQEPMPLVDAGWLTQSSEDGAAAFIEPCDFAKIHYKELIELAEQRKLDFAPGNRQSAKKKYGAWGAANGGEAKRQVAVKVAPLRPDQHPSYLPFLSKFGKASVPSEGGQNGVLVFTGQPSEWHPLQKPKAKHHDFVFFESAAGQKKIRVSHEVMEAFDFVHSDHGQQDRKEERSANTEWKFWQETFERGGRVPVFFLRWQRDQAGDSRQAGSLRAFGLAQMFRLAYDYSVRKGVENAQPASSKPEADLAELIFGAVSAAKDASPRARRGRMSIGLLKAVGSPREEPMVSLILGAPKASYYPNYVEQGDGHGDRAVGGKYRTFMDENVRIRGWKRYRPHPATQSQRRNQQNTERVETSFTPLAPGTKFRGKVRVHNLRPEELGAVLWALDFGGTKNAFHTFGLARSFGYGRVQIRVLSQDLRTNDDAEARPLSDYVGRFIRYMNAQLHESWEATVQIRDLLALAQLIASDSSDYEGRHMEIDHPLHGNEFQEARKPANSFALPPVGREQETAAVPVQDPALPLKTRSMVKVRLVQINEKGKWRAELPMRTGKGTISFGTPPENATPGLITTVLVRSGSDAKNLSFAWPDPPK